MARSVPVLLVLLGLSSCYPSFSFDLPGEAAGAAGEGQPAQGGADPGGAGGAPDSAGTGGTAGTSGADGGQGGDEAGSGGENIQGSGGGGAGTGEGGVGGAGAAGEGQGGGVLDDFEGTALGDGWSGNKQSFAVEGGALVAKGAGFLLWNKDFPATQEAWFRLVKPPAEGSAVGLVLKGQWQGPVVCNRLSVLYRPGSVEVRGCKGGKDELLGTIPAALEAGDVLRARYAAGDQVEVLRNGEPLGLVDAASAGKGGSGRIGVVAEGQPAAVVDDFGGQ